MLRTYQADDGRLSFGVRLNGRQITVRVHVVVAEAWHGARPPGMEAAHGDGDHTNNRPSNLRWARHVENEGDKRAHGTLVRGERSHLSRLTEADIHAIHLQYATGEFSHEELGAAFGVAPATIGLALQGRTWAHVVVDQSLPQVVTVGRGERNGRARLTESGVRQIRTAHAGGESISSLARRFEVARTAIQGVVHGKTWRHVR